MELETNSEISSVHERFRYIHTIQSVQYPLCEPGYTCRPGFSIWLSSVASNSCTGPSNENTSNPRNLHGEIPGRRHSHPWTPHPAELSHRRFMSPIYASCEPRNTRGTCKWRWLSGLSLRMSQEWGRWPVGDGTYN